MNKKLVYGAGGLALAGLVGGGIALAVIETKKKKAAKKVNAISVTGKPAAAVSSVNAPAAVEATPIPTMMTDDQAAVWAANYPILMGSDYHAAIAASSVLHPLDKLGLTADQVKKYNVAPPNETARSMIQRGLGDTLGPGTMTDDQAKTYGVNWNLYTLKSTSQADRNSAVMALAPIVGLRETPYQWSLFHGIPPDDDLRKQVAADFATLQATGNAPM